jgi:5-methyltetrahydrofolate--homocysteine methyltransferase
MKLADALEQRILILDGAMGTEILQRTGKSFECPDILNISSESAVILEIHRAYIDAGADIIETNTLGANRIKLEESGAGDRVEEINLAAGRIARQARADRPLFIAGSMGPLGKLIHPLGDITVAEAFQVFFQQARALEQGGVDFILIETQIDVLEAKTALRAARTATSLPVAVSLTFPHEEGRTVTGTDPDTAAVIFATPDTDFYGINCGGHPEKILKHLELTFHHCRKPLLVYANAGEPQKQGKITVFPLDPDEYLGFALKFYQMGASVIGGCCGTTPDHIRLIARELKGKEPRRPAEPAEGFRAAGRNRGLLIGGERPFRIIGENINPFARKNLAAEIDSGKLDLARTYARRQEQSGADALDINLGRRAEQDPEFFAAAVTRLQQVSSLPFLLDNRSPEALEAALRIYSGKAVINSVTAEKKSREILFPLAKKYGAAVVLLAMDEDGIPKSARKRSALIQDLYACALEYGLNRDDLLVDPVVLALASKPNGADVTLDTIELIDSLHIPTTIGLSNISFGLPRRRLINSSFLCMARQRGLDSAICDPLDSNLMSIICAVDALTLRDLGLKRYIETFSEAPEEPEELPEKISLSDEEALFKAVFEGEKGAVEPPLRRLVAKGMDGFAILKTILSPALQKAGEYYEQNIYFLPQLILAAEAMEAASGVLQNSFPMEQKSQIPTRIVLATVKGDLHDIGKNIVHLVLRNSGFTVIDLGKNADAETIIETARREKAEIIGLSSLMTTTLDEIQEVIRLKIARAPEIKVILGGAAVTAEYARSVEADAYGKDAMDAVRQVKKLLEEEP